MAVVSENTLVSEAVVAMTSARGGAAFITDANEMLLGIFTDGDFRRAIAANTADVLNRKVSDFMTRKPVNVRPDSLAVDVLRLIETRAIDDVPVVDANGKLVGAIDIQDLPKFKVM